MRYAICDMRYAICDCVLFGLSGVVCVHLRPQKIMVANRRASFLALFSMVPSLLDHLKLYAFFGYFSICEEEKLCLDAVGPAQETECFYLEG
jgi:hypothetical protein